MGMRSMATLRRAVGVALALMLAVSAKHATCSDTESDPACDDRFLELLKEQAIEEGELKCMYYYGSPSSVVIDDDSDNEGDIASFQPGLSTSTIHVPIAVALRSLSVSATVEMRGFSGVEFTLEGRPERADGSSLVSGAAVQPLTLKSARTGHGLRAQVKKPWTDQLEMNWNSGSTTSFLNAFRRSRVEGEKLVLKDLPFHDQVVFREGANYNQSLAGLGGSGGTWTLAMDSIKGAGENKLVGWSVEMCFDRDAHIHSISCPPGTSNDLALYPVSSDKVSAFGAESSSAPSLEDLGQPFAAPRPRFWYPGSAIVQSVRGAIADRLEEEGKCARARFSFNPLERLNRNFCCTDSRVFFLRKWWRKNFTFRCRTFYGNNIFQQGGQGRVSAMAGPAAGPFSGVISGLQTLGRTLFTFYAGAAASTTAGQVTAAMRGEASTALPIGTFAVAASLWSSCAKGEEVIVTTPGQWLNAFENCCNVQEVRGIAGALVEVGGMEGAANVTHPDVLVGHLSKYANRRVARVVGPDALLDIVSICHDSNVLLGNDTATHLTNSSLSPFVTAAAMTWSGAPQALVGDWAMAVWELQGNARLYSDPGLQYLAATYSNINAVLRDYFGFPVDVPQAVVDHLASSDNPGENPSGYAQIRSSGADEVTCALNATSGPTWAESLCVPAWQDGTCSNGSPLGVQGCRDSDTCFVQDPRPAHALFENDEKLVKMLTDASEFSLFYDETKYVALKVRAYLAAQLGLGPSFSGVDGFSYGCNPPTGIADGDGVEFVGSTSCPLAQGSVPACCALDCQGSEGSCGLRRHHKEFFAPNAKLQPGELMPNLVLAPLAPALAASGCAA